jgi:hypothetical protein
MSKLWRKVVRFGGIRDMASDGWTPGEAAQLVDSWPSLRSVDLSLVVSVAVAVRRQARADVAHVTAWTHALIEALPDGQSRPRDLAREEVEAHRQSGEPFGLPDLPGQYVRVIGSSTFALAALAGGLSLADARRDAVAGTLDLEQLRLTAARRGIHLPA